MKTQVDQMQINSGWDGHWLNWSRTVWGVLLIVGMGTWLYALPFYYKMLLTPCSGEDCYDIQTSVEFLATLTARGISHHWFGAWHILFVCTVAAIYGVCSLLLIARRSGERATWLYAFLFLIIGFFGTAAVDALVPLGVFWFYFINIANSVMWLSLVIIFCTFPNGRFVPAWSWVLMGPPIGLVIFLRLSFFLPDSQALSFGNWPAYLEPLLSFIIFGTCIITQIYRYRYSSSPVQRQQTKWIVFGLVLIALLFLLVGLGFGEQADTSLEMLLLLQLIALLILLTLPVTVTIAVLRYRLWDIDILIRRTLIYGVVTTLLALLYFGSVIALQALFRGLTGQTQSTFATALTTLAIVALFAPLRRRVQGWIDRRFYRRKYNAEQVLAAFSSTVRNETDLERLTAELIRVVEETVQPAQVVLWLGEPKEIHQ